jgi:hypothetical protein
MTLSAVSYLERSAGTLFHYTKAIGSVNVFSFFSNENLTYSIKQFASEKGGDCLSEKSISQSQSQNKNQSETSYVFSHLTSVV